LKGFLGLGSSNTVKSYAGFFEDAFLLFTVNGFSYSLKQQVLNPKKVYCIDNGLNNAISFRFSKDRGKFLENQVCIELKRKGFEIYYYRTRSGKEVDFVVREGNEIRKMIQVCYDFDGKTCRRETGALYEAMDELRMPEAMILTDDTETEMKSGSKTIAVKPVYRWLLEDEERND
jgi:predicted AAA+ superfamily ATPase